MPSLSTSAASIREADACYSHYRTLTLDSDKSFSALWGKLGCEILSGHWDGALEDLNTLAGS